MGKRSKLGFRGGPLRPGPSIFPTDLVPITPDVEQVMLAEGFELDHIAELREAGYQYSPSRKTVWDMPLSPLG